MMFTFVYAYTKAIMALCEFGGISVRIATEGNIQGHVWQAHLPQQAINFNLDWQFAIYIYIKPCKLQVISYLNIFYISTKTLLILYFISTLSLLNLYSKERK